MSDNLLIEFEPYDRYGEKYIYNRYVYRFNPELMYDLANQYGIDLEEELTQILNQEINNIR